MMRIVLVILVCLLELYLIYRLQLNLFNRFLPKEQRTKRDARYAVLWGGLAATILSIAFGTFVSSNLGGSNLSPKELDLIEGAFAAPLYEEFFKGLAPLIALFYFRKLGARKLFVLGAMSGLGFHLAETSLGLAGGIFVKGVSLSDQLVIRGIALMFMHSLATGFTGLGLGLATKIHFKVLKLVFVILGYSCAVIVHFSNNLTAVAVNSGSRVDQSEFFKLHLLVLLGLYLLTRILVRFKSLENIEVDQRNSALLA